MSLRLGALCAVVDTSGFLLLSRRGDLNIWALPGGRLDLGERLEEAARREVSEETGLRVAIDRAIGLYYFAAWRRVNVLFGAYPVGGRLRDETPETRANRYFTDGSLSQGVIGARDALAAARPLPRIITTPRGDLWRLRLRFGWRWLRNRLSGHPEPKFPIFDVQAAAVVLGGSTRRVLTVPEGAPEGAPVGAARQGGGSRMLPRVVCDGSAAPWTQLALAVQRQFGLTLEFQWVGLWEDPERAALELVFAATTNDRELPENAEWTNVRNGAFSDRDMAYVERVRPTYARDPVWSLLARADTADMVTVYKEAKL